jgi:hypothetical protein
MKAPKPRPQGDCYVCGALANRLITGFTILVCDDCLERITRQRFDPEQEQVLLRIAELEQLQEIADAHAESSSARLAAINQRSDAARE